MRPEVRVSFRDQSQVLPSPSDLNVGIVIRSNKGTVGKAVLVGSEKEFLEEFTKGGKIKYSDEPSLLSAVHILRETPLWVVRAYSSNDHLANLVFYYDGSSKGITSLSSLDWDTWKGYDTSSLSYPYAIVFAAKNPGSWGNDIQIAIESIPSPRPANVPPSAEGLLKVYIQDGSSSILVEEFYFSATNPDAKDFVGTSIYLPDVLKRSKYLDAKLKDPSGFPDFTLSITNLSNGGDDTGVIDKSSFLPLFDSIDIFAIVDDGNPNANYQAAITDYCASRGDCVAILSIPAGSYDVSSAISHVDNLRTLTANHSFAAIYSPWVEVVYDGRLVWVPPNAFVIQSIARNYRDYEVWYPPAGLNYGKISGRPIYEYSETEQSQLYDKGINPIIISNGTVIWGQKTLQLEPTALNRLNVRLLLNYLIPPIKEVLRSFLFEYNDEITRNRVVHTITPFLEQIKAKRGLYDFSIVCDETNNTPEDIDNNRLNVDVYLQPAKTVEIIRLNFTLTRTGVELK